MQVMCLKRNYWVEEKKLKLAEKLLSGSIQLSASSFKGGIDLAVSKLNI